MTISKIYNQQDRSYITNCHDSNSNYYYEDDTEKKQLTVIYTNVTAWQQKSY
jgi:hypothetical protein